MNNQKTFFIVFYGIIFGITVLLALVLFTEYRYFKHQAYELSQVKDAYYQHVDMLKRSLNASIVEDEEEEQELDSEKKKVNEGQPYTIDFDIEPEAEEAKPEFQIISKDEEYQLKKIKLSLKPETPKKRVVSRRRKIKKEISPKISRPSARYIAQRDYQFSWPIELQSFWLSSLFGPRRRPNGHVEFHHAIDMAAMKGTPVKAAAAGKVVIAQTLPGYGNCVMIQHNDRYKTRYGHLHRIYVKNGQYVQEGEQIASVGDTGLVRKSGRDASHLHFEIHQDGRRVNPLAFLFS
jgi:murein DD-endopeptidase MepM/ murein hydrolase activator NlpD